MESFLALAEFYVARGIPMAMEDWTVKLNTFIKLNELAFQEDGGSISRKSVDKIVKEEMAKWQKRHKLGEPQCK